jgi:gamma-glutamyltranspeptidase/glutathione hydrolase
LSKRTLGVAAGSRLGCDAAVEVARAGGNAVDACLAAAVAAWVTEPFFASVAGSGFVVVRSPEDTVEVFDGNNAVPLDAREAHAGMKRVFLDYSNGMYTGIGGGSVAVPGALAAAHHAWERYGSIEWPALLAPAIAAARTGIPFPATSAYYLSVTWGPIWSSYASARRVFGEEEPLTEGMPLVQPELADTLQSIATGGPGVLYGGELGEAIVAALGADGGVMTMEDLRRYSSEARAPVSTDAFGWHIASNPPPALGGARLTHMLALLAQAHRATPVERLRAIVDAERAALNPQEGSDADVDEVAAAGAPGPTGARSSSATTHASAADASGLVCAVTQSNGYGAGPVVAGVMVNNTMGEEELTPRGATGLLPGARCQSNMAPTIARGDAKTVGLGSPGADRIVGAIAQTIMAMAEDRRSLADAVAAPRAHLALRDGEWLLCFEPGLPGEGLGYTPRPYDRPHMFFGAVQAASVDEEGRVDAAHDPRRSGGSAVLSP